MIENVVIVEAVRSAVGRAHKGSLAQTRPDELAGQVIARAARARAAGEAGGRRGPRPRLRHARGRAGAQRRARRRAPRRAAGRDRARMTINRFCSSGLQAIAHRGGRHRHGLVRRRRRRRRRVDDDGADDRQQAVARRPRRCGGAPTVYTPMGITAENVAKRFGVSRADQDAFALESQQKAAAAREAGVFDDEIVPVQGHALRGRTSASTVEFKRDELIRARHDARGARRRSSRRSRKDGSVTAGNARRSRTARPRRS